MRSPCPWVVAVALLVGACSSGDDGSSGLPLEAPSASAPSTSEPSACPEVRAGINDFNAGDFEGTVDHFELALSGAQEQDDEERSAATGDLLEAVEYYADLPPEDYREAARSSPEFAKYKEITLGQCLSPGGQPPGSPPTSEEPVVPV